MAGALAGQQLAFLDFAFHVNNIHQLIGQGAELLGNPVAVFDSHYYTVIRWLTPTRGGLKMTCGWPERSGATASSNTLPCSTVSTTFGNTPPRFGSLMTSARTAGGSARWSPTP